MNNETFPIKDMWLYSPIELAAHIENVMGQYLISASELRDQAKETLNSFPTVRLLVASKRQLAVIEQPSIPYLGMSIVFECVKSLVEERSEWAGHRNCRFKEVMLPYIKREWHQTEEVFEHLRNLMVDVRTDVISYMGPNRWVIHFVRVRGHDILIEKSEDFRIYDWMRRHKAGEF